MGREHQAASNSHAMPGTLTGGTRRHRAHPLRALVAIATAVLVFQVGYVAPVGAATGPQGPVSPVAAPATREASPTSVPDGAAIGSPTPSPTPAPTEAVTPSPAASPKLTEAPASATPLEPAESAAAVEPSAYAVDTLPPLPAGATELVAERDAYSRAYSDATGELAREIFADPVFYQPTPDAAFVPIEAGFTTVPGADKAVVSDRAPAVVTVRPADDPRGFLALETDGFRVAYHPLVTDGQVDRAAAAAEAVIDGRRADLAEVFPGVDLRVFARAEGANTFLVLDAAPTEPRWTFLVDLPKDARLVTNDAGGVDILDATGALRMLIAAPWAVDSTPDEHTGSGRTTTALHYELGDLDGTPTLAVSVDDAAWLADAVYPVYVDPSMTIYNPGTQNYGDTFINKGNPDMNYGNYMRPDTGVYELWLGQSPSPTTDVARALFKFSLADLSGQSIDSATFKVYPYHQYHNAPTQQDAYLRRVTSDWDEHGSTSGVTWATRPNYTSSGTVTEGCIEGTACAFDVTAWTTGWLTGTLSNYGLQLDRTSLDYHDWGRLYSAEEDNHPNQRPRLVVSYHAISVTGTTPSFSNGISWDISSTLAQTRYEVEVSATNFGTPVASSSEVTDSANTWRISPALTDGATYWYRVRVSDGGGWSDWSTAASFVYDAQQRGAEAWWTSVPFDMGGDWGLDVGVHNGEARLARSLYDIPGYGPAQGLELSYSSANVASAGSFGYGWGSNLTQTLWRNDATSPTLVIWNRPDGARVAFTGSGTSWTPMSGHVESLSVSGTEWTVKEPDQGKLVFSLGSGVSIGKLTRIEDRFGKQLTFTWGGTSATVTSPSDQVTTLNYPGGSLITSVVDPAGRTWTFGYTGSDLTSITEPDPDAGGALAAPVTALGYASHLLTTVTRARRTAASGSDTLVWTIAYASGKVTGVIDPIAYASYASVASTFTYNSGSTVAALLKTYSPAARNSTTYAFDGLGRVVQSTDPNTFVTKFSWNTPSSTLAWIDVPLDGSTWTRSSYTYDASGNVLTETSDAQGDPSTTRYTYNATNDILTTEIADGTADEVVTTQEYDGAGHLTKVTANSADVDTSKRQVTEYAYNGSDLVSAEWVHLASASVGTTTTHAYNAYGVETATVENCTNTGTTQLGTPAWKTCSGGGTKDAATNVKAEWVVSLGTTAGKLGLPDSVTTGKDVTNRTTTYVYDALGRTTSETPPEGTTSHEWDQLGNEIRTTDPVALVTTRTLDRMNQVTTEVAPLRTTTYQYDAAGAVTQSTIAGDTVSRTYDGAGQLVSETVDPGSSPHLALTTEHAYDASGQEIASRDPDLTVTRTFYDAQGRVTKTIENCTSSGMTVWTVGDPGWKTCTGNGTKNATWNLTTTFTYDDRGNTTQEIAPNGRVTTWTYDDLDRLVKQVDNDVTSPTLPSEDVTTEYAYDTNGNQAATKSPATGTSTGYRITRSFFDALGRVTKVTENCTESGTTPPGDPAWKTCSGNGTKNASTNVETTFTYDADGNRLSVTGPNPAATSGTSGDYLTTVTTRYAYDTAGRLCRVLENASTDLQSLTNPCTDAVSGTTTTNVSTRYTYDARGNLATMTDGRGNTTCPAGLGRQRLLFVSTGAVRCGQEAVSVRIRAQPVNPRKGGSGPGSSGNGTPARDVSEALFVEIGMGAPSSDREAALRAGDDGLSVPVQPTSRSATKAIETIYGDHHRDVYRYVLGLTRSSEDAEEITADTFERALRNWRSTPPRPVPWLLLTARRIATDRWRRARRLTRILRESRPEREPSTGSEAEFRVWFEAVAAVLTDRQREVLILRYQRDLTDADIGTVMGLSESGVRSLAARALAVLREHPELLA